MDVSRDELIADVLYQISALDGLAKVAGSHSAICETTWRTV